MSIPSQLPLMVLAARAGALQSLALQAGQAVEGKVIGPAPNGGTQVQINGQMLNLVLPTLAKAGMVLNFEVQGSGAQMRLALQPPPSAAPVVAQTSQSVPMPPPAVARGNLPLSAAPAPVSDSGATPVPQATGSPPAVLPGSGQGGPPVSTVPTGTPQALPAVGSPPSAIQVTTAAPTSVPASAPVVAASPVLATNVTPQNAAPGSPASGGASPSQAAAAYPQTVQSGGVPVAAAASVSTPVVAGQPVPSTPQAALAQMVQASVPRQDGIGSLTVALSAVAGKVALPEPVIRAAQQVLAGRVNLGEARLDGASLQKAVQSSGVFQEATLARGAVVQAQGDMKTALLTLRHTLTAWLGNSAPLAAVAHIPPPLKGSVPRARPGGELTPVDPELPPQEVGKQLLERTEAALSRVRLHQHASLPDAQAKAGADWSMDLPVMIGTHQTMMQMQIHRDQQGSGEGDVERGWQMRFAINLPNLGEVGAQVSLRGTATGVMLWASEDATSAALEEEIGALRETLVSVGLSPGPIIVRHGEPAAAPQAASGHFVDART